MNTTMKYRRLGNNNEPVMGQGQQDFISGVEAVGQAVVTRLRLFRGEWWEDTGIGLPLWQSMLGILGVRKDSIDRILQDYILQTINITNISEVYSSFNQTSRGYQFYCEADTIFGQVVITNSQGSIQR